MPRIVLLVALLALASCNDESDHVHDAALAVPGVENASVPPANPPEHPVAPAPTTYDPPLAVPGVQGPITPTPQLPPGMVPGQMPPGQMPPGQMPPGQMPPGQMPPGQAPPGQVPPGQVPPGQLMQPGQQPMQPAGAPIPLATGFMPDPQVVRGMTTGQNAASTMQAGCAGFIPMAPNHVLNATTAFSNLRILVTSQTDTMLLVRAPDGSVRCNDDTDGTNNLNPTVAGSFAPGQYLIYVGTYQANAQANYVLGFTELPQVTHQSLAAAP